MFVYGGCGFFKGTYGGFISPVQNYRKEKGLCSVLKGMRNDVNRKVNCETANINKTVSAALSQLEDIQLIKEMMGLEKLTSNLEAVANARLENPDASLVELGKMIIPQLGKSGVNHRLRKLSDIASQLREQVRRENG